jgi:four helix bundle protein
LHKSDELQLRTREFVLRIVKLCRALPKNSEGRVFGNQLLRSGTAVAANYRSACRSRSTAEFASRIGIVLEEADETSFWLEMLADTGTLKASRLEPLRNEVD